jgi:hypothetical protein
VEGGGQKRKGESGEEKKKEKAKRKGREQINVCLSIESIKGRTV